MRWWALSIFFLLLTALSSLDGQQAVPTDKVSYEGHKVGAVDLVANPRIPIDSLRPLVQQKSGEPYSANKVKNTISALQATGRFSKVQLEIKPDPKGLHLTFTLEPALYFGILRFPGATKAFRYTRLLQVVDIPNQAPYKGEVVAKAAGALLEFFISAGYFQAEVQVESKFDQTYMLADVVFHVNLGKRAKVGNVERARQNG